MKNMSKILFLSLFLLTGCGDNGGNNVEEPDDEIPDTSIQLTPQTIITNPEFSGDYVLYGYYPQSVVANQRVISELDKLTPDENNIIEFQTYEFYVFDGVAYKSMGNNYDISAGKHYYLVEPITWQIAEFNDNNYALVCTDLLDTNFWNNTRREGLNDSGIYSNNYEYSSIRKWLNEDFYEFAFSKSDEAINIMDVDNSSESCRYEGLSDSYNNIFGINNTSDKVDLPSLKEIDEYDMDISRIAKPTDFAMARGCVRTDFADNGYFYLRSPYYDDGVWDPSIEENKSASGEYAYVVNPNGTFTGYYVNATGIGIRPQINVRIE